ncbi:hypothetical protein GF339_06815 [candidate division KSB3 bacterium]|uniref:Uncharacterized protein n=1 Tax=candidate division KSB3 bacterium TaxID=2044937 RepID=A0A9D5JU46_9BACT|nr:hypothetical protein [candidate division KSB3 bacterium]MBD3324278.1 hypothetical protein [candidate division KSB3 bacterium]
MRDNSAFEQELARLKRGMRLATLHHLLLRTLLIVLGLYTLAIGLEWLVAVNLRGEVAFYLLALALALLLAGISVFLTRKRIIDILIDIDTRLALHDRLSTAYEYHTAGKASTFKNLLIDEAQQALSHLTPKQMLPPNVAPLYRLFAVLIALNLVLLLVEHPPEFWPQASRTAQDESQSPETTDTPKAAPTSEVRENTATTSADLPPKPQEEIPNASHTPDMSQNSSLATRNPALKNVQGQPRETAQDADAGTRLEDIGLRELPVQQSPQFQQLSTEERNTLRNALNQMLHDQAPPVIEDERATLDQRQNLEEMLAALPDDLTSEEESGDPLQVDRQNSPNQDEGQSEQEANTSQNRSDNETSSSVAQNRDDERKPGGSGRGNASNRDGDADPDRDLADEDSAFAAGHGTSDGQKLPPNTLDTADGPALQDNILSARQEQYTVPIRSVTQIGESSLPEEEVVRVYRQELESILHKDEIPLNYREYIKNYFLLIGIREDQTTHATTD